MHPFLLMTLAILVAAMTTGWSTTASAQPEAVDPHEIVRRMGTGINVGSSLDAHDYFGRDDVPGSPWSGGVITEADIQRIKDAGFTHVRIPVRWSRITEHVGKDQEVPAFLLDEVEKVVDWVLERDMVAIVNQHHENPLFEDPQQEDLDRFVLVWDQVAQRFKDKPANLVFELLNEPHGDITAEQLNNIYHRAFAKIRATNPTRNVVIGGRGYNGWWHLINEVQFPDDPYLIGTFHRYGPNDFSHQGVHGRKDKTGIRYDQEVEGTTPHEKAIEGFDELASWSQETGIPVWLGEFGVSVPAPHEDAQKYLRRVSEEARKRGFALAVWSYHDVNFGLWDRRFDGAWDKPALEAILPADANDQQ